MLKIPQTIKITSRTVLITRKFTSFSPVELLNLLETTHERLNFVKKPSKLQNINRPDANCTVSPDHKGSVSRPDFRIQSLKFETRKLVF